MTGQVITWSRSAAGTNRLTLLAYAADPSVWALVDALPRHSDNPEILRQTVRALTNVADTATELGHDRTAGRLLREGHDLAHRVGYPLAECYITLALLRLDLLAGHLDGLEERFAEVVAAYPVMNLPLAEQALLLGQLGTARGHRDQAVEHFTGSAVGRRRGGRVAGPRGGGASG